MKRVIVTGGSGFIGSHLCKRLLARGNYVISIDNYSSGKRDNLSSLRSSPNFEEIEHDIIHPINIEADEIYNLASPASPVDYHNRPLETIKSSFLGALNMLELANSIGAKILQASTSEVYGDPQLHPQSEDYWGNVNPIGTRACYDEGKRAAETLFIDYNRVYHLPVKIARIFNSYGPNMRLDDGRVVSNFIVQALRGEELTIYGDGEQTRSFLYVDDLVEGLIALMATEESFRGPLNLGNPSEVTVKELAQLILKLTNSSSKVIYLEAAEDDPKRRCPDISLAKERLVWSPKHSIESGLLKTINYFKNLS